MFPISHVLASEKHSSLTLPTSMESVGVPVNTPCEFSARIADERNNPVISNQLRVVCEPATVTKLSVKKAGTNGMRLTVVLDSSLISRRVSDSVCVAH